MKDRKKILTSDIGNVIIYSLIILLSNLVFSILLFKVRSIGLVILGVIFLLPFIIKVLIDAINKKLKLFNIDNLLNKIMISFLFVTVLVINSLYIIINIPPRLRGFELGLAIIFPIAVLYIIIYFVIEYLAVKYLYKREQKMTLMIRKRRK